MSSLSTGEPNLYLERLIVRGVRNLAHVDLVPSPRFNLVVGDNGQGKTSLLEAIYVAATSKSFRTSRLAEVVSHHASGFAVRARFVERRGLEEPIHRDQSAALDASRVELRVDGNRPPRAADFAVKSPVVVFHPDELLLSTGPAAIRRRLLDRVALYRSPMAAACLAAYGRALKTRQEILRRSGVHAPELDAYETILAERGAEVTRARAEAASDLATDAVLAFARIGAPELSLRMSFERGGSDDPQTAKLELEKRRPRDVRSLTASFGPHRDELQLTLEGHAARLVASQGQHRALTLALKVAESATVARVTGLDPILLLDDVSSELDKSRMQALFRFLDEARGQVFITTPRPDLLEGSVMRLERKEFRVVEGAVMSAS
jgi:DNA replication and repair protein RecF